MADNKDDKPGAQDTSINDSGELLKQLFREELDALTLDGKPERRVSTLHRGLLPEGTCAETACGISIKGYPFPDR